MTQLVNATCLLNKIRGDYWMDEPKFEYLFNKLDKKQPVVVTGWKKAAKKAAWDNSDADFWAGWVMDYSHDMGFNTYVQ